MVSPVATVVQIAAVEPCGHIQGVRLGEKLFAERNGLLWNTLENGMVYERFRFQDVDGVHVRLRQVMVLKNERWQRVSEVYGGACDHDS